MRRLLGGAFALVAAIVLCSFTGAARAATPHCDEPTALCTEPKAIHLMLSPAHAQVADAYLADLAQALAEVRAGASGSDVRARYA